MRRGRLLGSVLAFERRSNWHPPLSRERPGGRACPSWRVWREPVSRYSPGDFGACGGALEARRKGVGASAGGGGGGLPAFSTAALGTSAPCRSLPALAPAWCSLVASLPAVPGLWNSCVCKLPREERGCTLVRRAHGPRKASGACQSLEGEGPLEAVLGGASEWTPALKSLEAWAPAGRPCREALATSRNGWKEDGCDCRRGGKGKMLVPSALLLLSRRRGSCQPRGLAQPVLGGGW